MKSKIYLLLKLFFVFVILSNSSCNSEEKPVSKSIDDDFAPQKDSFVETQKNYILGDLLNNLDTISTPIHIPSEIDSDINLDTNYLTLLRNTYSETSAFNLINDISALVDNSEVSEYSAHGKIIINDSTQLLILSKLFLDNQYFYLISLDKKLNSIDGICIAFKEGENQKGIARHTLINENILQIVQESFTAGKETKRKSSIFEINSFGYFNRL
jgi:hypothetical protein